MKIIQSGSKFLLLVIGIITSVNVLATDYYWNTTNPPGTVHWTEGTTVFDGDNLFINDPLNTTQTITNSGNIEINSSLILNNNILQFSAGMRDVTVNNGATLQIAGSNLIIVNSIGNLGTLDFPASASINSVETIGNAGLINMAGTINSGLLFNVTNLGVDGVINFSTGAVVDFLFSDSGTLTINNDISFNFISNSDNLVLAASITGRGLGLDALENGGNMTVSGNRSINNAELASLSSSVLNFSITDATTYDSLHVSGNANISDCDVNITSLFSGPGGTNLQWDILTSGTSIVTDGATVINIPASTVFETWSSEIIANTILRLHYINTAPFLVPLPGVDTEIANVLAAMQANVTNSGQAELLAAVNSVGTQDLYNYLLSNLQPDTNNSSSSTTLAMQNIGFNKIETRVAGISHKHHAKVRKKKKRDKKSKINHTKNTSGFASGELTPNTAMWIAGFGSLSKQHASGDNQGYRANILGGMLGVDTRSRYNDVCGIAFGVSNANVYGLENTTFTTRILGYNLMLYGANNFKYDFFSEWILSGVINKNHGVRVFGVNGIDLSTESSYRGALGGVRLNFGKSFHLNDNYNLSQVNTVQYVMVHQEDYYEDGSVAALHVVTKENQSILTLGTGFRLGIYNSDSWMNGNRELRAMVTYDVISPNQATTANFVVGSNSFIMNSTPVRLALKLGADYGLMISRKLSLQFSYDYEMRAGYYENFGEVKLRYLF